MMLKKYEIVCVCGSTKFKDLICQTMRDITLEGYVVLGPCVFSQSDKDCPAISITQKIMLDEIHAKKIEMADRIIIINPDGYIGESTCKEIILANKLGKQVEYIEDPK